MMLSRSEIKHNNIPTTNQSQKKHAKSIQAEVTTCRTGYVTFYAVDTLKVLHAHRTLLSIPQYFQLCKCFLPCELRSHRCTMLQK